MTWLLIFVRELCLAIWLGGLLVIDFVETPIRFRTPEISKEQASAVGARLFARFGWIQIGTGIVLLCDCFAIAQKTAFARGDSISLICVVLMLIFALVQSAYLTPQMLARLSSDNNGTSNAKTDRGNFRALHIGYVVLDVLKLLAGLTVLFFISWSYAALTVAA